MQACTALAATSVAAAARRPGWRPHSGGPAAGAVTATAAPRFWLCAETPNPDVRKFERAQGGELLLGAEARERLLALDGVRDVFVAVSQPWVSVTRAGGVTWEALVPQVQAVLGALPTAAGVAEAAAAPAAAPGGTEAEIEEVLLRRVRPGVQADGGDVTLLRWEPALGKVVLRMQGACRGCPQSAVTLQETILRALQHFIPEVRSVEAEEEPFDAAAAAADPTSDLPWLHTGRADPVGIQALSKAGTPFFSTFAGVKVDSARLRRVQFRSDLELAGRKPGHVHLTCSECKARRTIEDPNDLLLPEKGNTTGNALVQICPTCAVVISL